MFILKTIVRFNTSKISKMMDPKNFVQHKINIFTKVFTHL